MSDLDNAPESFQTAEKEMPQALSLSEKFDEALVARDNNPMNITVDVRTVFDHWVKAEKVIKNLYTSSATAEQLRTGKEYAQYVLDGMRQLIRQKQQSIGRVSKRQASIFRKIGTFIPFTKEFGKRADLHGRIHELDVQIGRIESQLSRLYWSTAIQHNGDSIPTAHLVSGRGFISRKDGGIISANDINGTVGKIPGRGARKNTDMVGNAAVDGVTGAVVGPVLGMESGDAASLNVVGGLLGDIFND